VPKRGGGEETLSYGYEAKREQVKIDQVRQVNLSLGKEIVGVGKKKKLTGMAARGKLKSFKRKVEGCRGKGELSSQRNGHERRIISTKRKSLGRRKKQACAQSKNMTEQVFKEKYPS